MIHTVYSIPVVSVFTLYPWDGVGMISQLSLTLISSPSIPVPLYLFFTPHLVFRHSQSSVILLHGGQTPEKNITRRESAGQVSQGWHNRLVLFKNHYIDSNAGFWPPSIHPELEKNTQPSSMQIKVLTVTSEKRGRLPWQNPHHIWRNPSSCMEHNTSSNSISVVAILI